MAHPLLCALLILHFLATPASAQTIGGSYETVRTWDGAASFISFGYSVSNAGDVNGDGFDDQIIGAPYSISGGLSLGGEAYVYSGADGSELWQFQSHVSGDSFGYSVSGAGDVNGDGFDDLLIGLPFADPNGLLDAGSAQVYSGADGTLLHQLDGPAAGDRAGYSVSDAGDVNADGFDDVLLGAYRSSSAGLFQAGAAFVYSGVDGSLLHRLDGFSAGDEYGWSVSGAGDANGDGFDDVLVGAWLADSGISLDTGSAYLHSGADGSLLQQWDGANPSTYLGSSVSGAGDLNADGFSDVVLGVKNGHGGGLFFNGVAFAHSGVDGSLLHTWSGAMANDIFGHSVSAAGDVDGDGHDDVLISAPNASADGFVSNGTVGLYSGADSTLLHQWSGSESWIRIGDSVSSAGDADGDGLDDVLIGSKDAFNPGLLRTGSAFLHHLDAFLDTSATTVSLASGGTIDLDLHFPNDAGLEDYRVLISATGDGPVNFGVDIPITADGLASSSFVGNYPMPTVDMHGQLDTSGEASASFTIPTGLNPNLAGRTLYLAAICNESGQLPIYSSISRRVQLVP